VALPTRGAAVSAGVQVNMRGNATKVSSMAWTPRPARAKKPIVFSGKLLRMSLSGQWGPLRGRTVSVWFVPANGQRALVKRVQSSRSGSFRVSAVVPTRGIWTFEYAGSSRLAAAQRSLTVPV
jgi:hypothetical protein